ncbi:MAG: polysaccharide biosynthesis C-terminal domain-containing protein [Saprospiraceae bacterium]
MKYFQSQKFIFLQNDIVLAYQVSQIFRYLINILLSIVLVKSEVSLKDIGQLEITLFVIALISQFWVSGIKDNVLTSWNQGDETNRKRLLHQGWISLTFLGILSMVVFWCVFPLFFWDNISGFSRTLLSLGSFYLVFNAVSSYPETVLLLQNKPQRLWIFAVASFVLFFLLVFIFYYFYSTIVFVILLLTILAIAKCLYLVVILPPFVIESFKFILTFLKQAVPFFLIAIVGYSMDMMDGFLVVHFFDVDQFPIFRYGARELPLSSMLMNALSVAMIPALIDVSKTSLLKQKVDRHMHVLFPLTILLIWISPAIFVFIYNMDFKTSAYIFNTYLIILGSRLLLPQSVLIANGKQKWVLWSGIIELIINLVLSLWWVRLWGLQGLVLATVVAYYVQKVGMLYWLYKEFKITIMDLISWKWWIFYQVLAFLSLYAVNIWNQ